MFPSHDRQGRGRISPLKTLLAIAPSEQFRGFTRGLPGGTTLDQALYGTGVTYGGPMGTTEIAATQGLIGTGGEFGLGEFMKGSLLSPMKDGVPTLSKARVAGLVAAGASLATTQEQIEEEGEVAANARVQVVLPNGEFYDINGMKLLQNKLIGVRESHRLVFTITPEKWKMGKVIKKV